MRNHITAGSLAMLSLVLSGCSSQPAAPSKVPAAAEATASTDVAGGRPASTGVIFVSSQGLYFDTIVVKDPLPFEGRFQLLENGVTEFGPGDPGYLGGRWWEDTNGNDIQDPTDHYFLCPLLPPGRETP
jgi:hypothetical protein